MTNRIKTGGLKISADLYALVANEITPGTGIDPEYFWSGFETLLDDLGPVNRRLLDRRDSLQQQIDDWHRSYRTRHGNGPIDPVQYQAFLTDIGYLVPEGDPFKIETRNVDEEIALIAGPQLVVPVNNPRFALNAANARWGSLYDALYGTDVIDAGEGGEKGTRFNPVRAARVIAWAADFLDQAVPLASGSHALVLSYSLVESAGSTRLAVTLGNGETTALKDPQQFVGFGTGSQGTGQTLLLRNHGLHIELQLDREHPVGALSASGLKDVVLESALSTIMDCEDSVAAVDGPDKVQVYRSWLGLMQGTLQETFTKGERQITRRLNDDRHYSTPTGESLCLHGRSLLLVRNVGHLMTTDAVLDRDNQPVPEGFLDAVITSLCALHDLQGAKAGRNSRAGSLYIVKPKMHGPEEAALTNELFTQVEQLLGLAPNTLKVGVMDEERRTSANLAECIRAVRERLFFINTGFLDRTGDEIHTSMQAGPVLPKDAIKAQPWISAYEDRNVDIGLACGLRGRAQIGKGMWAMPDEMKQMIEAKIAHPEAGASCAWVPSPTAATLHVTHYHRVNVAQRQAALEGSNRATLATLLSPPLLEGTRLSAEQVQAEVDNNVQGILGYVVRWIDQGIGCSKVPDIHNIGLMEDRATLRISSQHLANWLLHGICTDDQVMDTLRRMAVVVDAQNAADPAYRRMVPELEHSVAFQAACDLIFLGCEQPSGYTEPLLHQRRREKKALQLMQQAG